MTFNSAAWAIDGAIINSSLARSETFNATGGAEGVSGPSHLKVTALSTPGRGVRIAAGGAILLNKYQATPDQTYVVSNSSIYTIPEAEMPTSSASARSFIVAITIGDPEFSQVGHPWMLSTDPPEGAEGTFQYVRPVLIPVAAGATTISGALYPHLPLARIDLPANTTTITSAMITDLRQVGQPRQKTAMGNVVVASGRTLTTTSQVNFPRDDVITIQVPTWATTCRVMGYVQGLVKTANGWAQLAVNIRDKGITGPVSHIDEPPPSGSSDRVNVNFGATLDVSSLRGQTVSFTTVAWLTSSAASGFLSAAAGTTSVGMQLLFEEGAV